MLPPCKNFFSNHKNVVRKDTSNFQVVWIEKKLGSFYHFLRKRKGQDKKKTCIFGWLESKREVDFCQGGNIFSVIRNFCSQICLRDCSEVLPPSPTPMNFQLWATVLFYNKKKRKKSLSELNGWHSNFTLSSLKKNSNVIQHFIQNLMKLASRLMKNLNLCWWQKEICVGDKSNMAWWKVKIWVGTKQKRNHDSRWHRATNISKTSSNKINACIVKREHEKIVWKKLAFQHETPQNFASTCQKISF